MVDTADGKRYFVHPLGMGFSEMLQGGYYDEIVSTTILPFEDYITYDSYISGSSDRRLDEPPGSARRRASHPLNQRLRHPRLVLFPCNRRGLCNDIRERRGFLNGTFCEFQSDRAVSQRKADGSTTPRPSFITISPPPAAKKA
jgi:hypothetical protein